jgi:ABC-type polysaccharide/polyol phosphate transport system ATPase subunit
MSTAIQPLVRFEEVSKKFRRGERHSTLRDLIPAFTRSLLRPDELRRQEFWALRDISFEVGAGEVLGIIGPNGAGKSTALKLLTGILRPNRGRVIVQGRTQTRGRIGALIELAAGFHYELTGRENIFLQGAIMGMSRAEIARKFDEIVAFAGIGEFIDTPVKRYSSGMNARLGFSIAAHLDPDILVVDEVLAVGDLGFQQQAFARLRELVRREIPVVVVSHQLNRVTEFCTRAILLTRGEIVCAGSPAECVAAYVGEQPVGLGGGAESPVQITGISAPTPVHVPAGGRTIVRVQGQVLHPERSRTVTVGVRVRALPTEQLVFTTNSADCGVALDAAGPFELEIELQMNVGAGTYRVQGVVWSLSDRAEWTRGPSTLVSVAGSPTCYGPVYPSPRMRLLVPRCSTSS